MSRPPVKVNQQYFSLATVGVEQKYFAVKNIGFPSDRGIGVCDQGPDGTKRFAFIDFKNNFNVMRNNTPIDAGLPHPKKNILAFRVAQGDTNVIQIFDLTGGARKKIKDVKIQGKYSYWSWADDNTLGFVTTQSVYHLDITKGINDSSKMMDRRANMVGAQVISYQLDPQGKYATISGISTPDGGKTINGNCQLCLIEQGKQQSLNAYYGVFGNLKIRNDLPAAICYAYAERDPATGANKLNISEISPVPAGQQKFRISVDMQYPAGSETDFPVFMSTDSKHGVIYIATKGGILFMYEASTGARILASRISKSSILTGAPNEQTGGIFLYNAQGNVVPVDTDAEALIQFIKSNPGIPNGAQLATNVAIRNGLPGAEQYFIERFNTFMMNQQYKEAAQVVANSPAGLLRNKDTIEKFRALPKQPGKPYPLIQYFFVLLESTNLNEVESLEICAVVLSQNKKQFIQDWITKEKLHFTEALGDLVKPYDMNLAASIYEKAGSAKAVQAKIASGNIQEAMSLAGSMGGNIDFIQTIRDTVVTNPDQALAMAKQLTKAGNVQASKVAEVFMTANRPNELTNYCVECLTENKPEDAQWQTVVLEICLKTNPSAAENIFASGRWTQYNKQRVAPLCEQKGLLSRALECYTDISDIRRVILNTQMFQPNYLIEYIGKQSAENQLSCLTDLIKHNRQNTELVVKIASQNFQTLGVAPVVGLLESVSAYDGIYFFLGAILPNTQDPEIYFKYMESCVKCNKIGDIERVIREAPNCYDPLKVKEFLLQQKLPNPKPLIVLCDTNGYIAELTRYLWENNFKREIQLYIFQVNTNASPEVLGTLIDLEVEESYIKQLLYNLRGNCPADELIEEFTKRSKLRVLEEWLEQRVAEGNSTASIHNALAKIVIDTDKDPQKFLAENQHYNSKDIGQYCEETDPHLAVIAYERDFGNCDYELIELTNKNTLYRVQAKYLVKRKDKELWEHVLTPDNPHRQYIIEQVVSSALPDSKDVDEVSCAVQALLAAGLNLELISLLEKIVLHNSEFSGYKQLQNLLIITAIKNDKERVMDYINRLDNFDGHNIAKIARGEDYKLYEEAYVIYTKIEEHVEAINMLIYYIESLERSADYAEKINKPEVWSVLGKAYLTKQFDVDNAVECFIKAKDGAHFMDIISAAQNENKWETLIKFLLMARETKKDSHIDSELLFAYAKLNQLTEIESFIANPNSSDSQRVGDKCFQNKLYEAAKIFYTKMKSNAKIASCLVHLRQFPQAIEAARKANNTRTWKEIAMACISMGEYRLAAQAGQNIVVHPDHLEELVKQYERYDVPDEMIGLLETCLSLEKSHIGIYTVLGKMYAKYKPEKLLDYIRSYFKKLNVPKLQRTCERYMLWNEVVYLHQNYNEEDKAIKVMIEHSPSAFKHDLFLQIIQKVNNSSIFYDSISFYLEEEPKLLNELLRVITTKVDLSKVVTLMKKAGYLPIIVEWLQSVQSKNNQAVNDALNSLYLEIEDFDALRQSIANFESIDALGLAKQIEGHDNEEFRRISALIFRRNKKYKKSIELSKGDKQFRDAIETAQESNNPKLAGELLEFFATEGLKEFFTVCSYTCYELVRPDKVMELAWRYGMSDFAMPFFIQMVSELTKKVEKVEKKNEEREKKEEKKKEEEITQSLDMGPGFGGMNTGSTMPMLMGAGMNMNMGGMGGSMGGMGGSMGGMGGSMGGMGGMGL